MTNLEPYASDKDREGNEKFKGGQPRIRKLEDHVVNRIAAGEVKEK